MTETPTAAERARNRYRGGIEPLAEILWGSRTSTASRSCRGGASKGGNGHSRSGASAARCGNRDGNAGSPTERVFRPQTDGKVAPNINATKQAEWQMTDDELAGYNTSLAKRVRNAFAAPMVADRKQPPPKWCVDNVPWSKRAGTSAIAVASEPPKVLEWSYYWHTELH